MLFFTNPMFVIYPDTVCGGTVCASVLLGIFSQYLGVRSHFIFACVQFQ